MKRSDTRDAILLPVAPGMQRRTILFLSLAMALLVFAAVAWWLGDHEPPDPPENGGGVVHTQPPQPTGRPTGLPDRPPATAGMPRVAVTVTAGEKLVAPPPVRVQAVRAGDGAELPTVLLAGAGAGFDTSPHAAGAALCEIGAEGARVL